jgi:potassium-transporting ATPase ATP-binding subunit
LLKKLQNKFNSIANDVASILLLPAMIIKNNPHLQSLNIMQIHSPETAILSTLIFNAMIIPDLIPFITKVAKFKPEPPQKKHSCIAFSVIEWRFSSGGP